MSRTKTQWYFFNTADLDEILACMEDSDRYIVETRKNKIISEIKSELSQRSSSK